MDRLDGVKRLYGEPDAHYYVMREGGRAPTFAHDARFKAHKEATRLARKHPGSKFHIVKLKATVLFEQDVKLNDRVRIKDDHESDYRGRKGQVMSIDPNGAYGIKLDKPTIDFSTLSRLTAFYRNDFEIIESADPRIFEGVRFYSFGTSGALLTGTVGVVEDENQTFVGHLDKFSRVPVRVRFDQFNPISPKAFRPGDWVQVNETHHAYAGNVGVVFLTDDNVVYVRFNDLSAAHFHPGSLTVRPLRPAFANDAYVRIVTKGAEDRVGIVDHTDDFGAFIKFRENGPPWRYGFDRLRPAKEEEFEPEPAPMPNEEPEPFFFVVGDEVRYANGIFTQPAMITEISEDGMQYTVTLLNARKVGPVHGRTLTLEARGVPYVQGICEVFFHWLGDSTGQEIAA